MEYRVEQKYIVSDSQIEYLKMRLTPFMSLDQNMLDESYLIRSVYFDDLVDTCFYENESGADNREKFRIRTYDGDASKINLELKGKKRGYTSKKSVALSKDEANRLLDKKTIFDINKESREIVDSSINNLYLKDKISAEMEYRRLQAVCIIEYERMALIEEIGNVRITFDKNIGVSREISTFFDPHIPVVPVMPLGKHILEVKYDELLPDYIKSIIDSAKLTKTAFSKYYFGRTVM